MLHIAKSTVGKIRNATPLTNPMRRVKSAEEIGLLVDACRVADMSMGEITRHVAGGITERELSEEVHRFEGGILLLEENKENIEDDFVEHLFIASAHSTMLFFTDRGKCYWLKVHQIPQGSRTSQGRAIVNLIGCEPGDKVKAFVSVKEFNDTDSIVMATRKGIIKRSALSLYSKPRKGGIYAIEIREDDELIEAKISNGDQDIVLATSGGKAIRFAENSIRSTGRKTMGVRGIRLSSKDDRVMGMLVVKREGSVMVVTDKGYGKRSDLSEYRTQHRGGKGVITIKTTDKVGKLVGIMEAIDTDDLMLITNQGIMIRQPVENIRTIGRNTQGVRLAKLDEGTFISSAARVIRDEDEDENGEEEITEE